MWLSGTNLEAPAAARKPRDERYHGSYIIASFSEVGTRFAGAKTLNPPPSENAELCNRQGQLTRVGAVGGCALDFRTQNAR